MLIDRDDALHILTSGHLTSFCMAMHLVEGCLPMVCRGDTLAVAFDTDHPSVAVCRIFPANSETLDAVAGLMPTEGLYPDDPLKAESLVIRELLRKAEAAEGDLPRVMELLSVAALRVLRIHWMYGRGRFLPRDRMEDVSAVVFVSEGGKTALLGKKLPWTMVRAKYQREGIR